MSPTNHAATQLRHQIFYHLDNDVLDTANFLAGRLHALEPRNPDSSHLLALTYFRLRRFKAAYDFSQKYGANGRHLGCAYLFAQACMQLGRHTEGVTALEKSKAMWQGKSNWNKHTETSRRHLPDAPACWTLLAKLWQSHGDPRKAGDCYIEAHRTNPFVWDAFEGLCKVGADLKVENMFRPTAEMGVVTSMQAGGSEIYTDEPPQPLAPQTSFNQQIFTPSADPFNTSRPGQEAGAQFVLPNIKGKSALGNGIKGIPEWDTPTANGSSVLDEDVPMGGVLVDHDSLAAQPPAAPSRRTRPGQQYEASDRPRQPALRSAPEGHDERKASAAGGHKRTISGQQPSDPSAPPRRSNRLFGQSSHTTKTSTSRTAGAEPPNSRPAKPATGAKGRVGSTVGRVVSGNRKMLPPDRNNAEKEKEALKRAPSRNNSEKSVVTAPNLPPRPTQQPPIILDEPLAEQSQALTTLLDNLRDLAIGTYATSRFDTPLAIRTLRSLPTAQRETPWVLSQLGKAHYESADYRSAEDCFARVLKLQPSRMQDMEVYSTVLWHLKKDSALAFLCHVLRESDYNAPQTWVAAGNAFSLAREHDQAIAAFKRATQVDAGFAYAWTLMGHEYIANEAFDDALASFRTAVGVDRRGYGGWYGLGKCYERMGKLEDAERHYRIAASINPSNSTLLVCIGVILERQRNEKAALTNYSRALELAPTSALARFKKARVLMHLGFFSEALVELEVLRDQAPDEANVWFLLGKCYKGLGERGEALRALTTALNLDVKAAPFIKEAMEALDDDEEDESEED